MATLILRNFLAVGVMVALCGAALWAFIFLSTWVDPPVPLRIVLVLAVAIACGVAGHFLFRGGPGVRTWLVFLSIVAFGGLMVALHDPARTFYPLLTSLPFAGFAAAATRFTAMHLESKRARLAAAQPPARTA